MLEVPKPGDPDEMPVKTRMSSGKMSTLSIAICTSNA